MFLPLFWLLSSVPMAGDVMMLQWLWRKPHALNNHCSEKSWVHLAWCGQRLRYDRHW
jgi:hypothetical protein